MDKQGVESRQAGPRLVELYTLRGYAANRIGKTILRSIKEATVDQYQNYLDKFIVQAKADGKVIEPGSVAEYEYYLGYCEAIVAKKFLNPSTLKKLRQALGKLHQVALISDDTRATKKVNEQKGFFLGLMEVHEQNVADGNAKAPQQRLDMPEEMVDDLIDATRRAGYGWMAVGLRILYHSLFRHSQGRCHLPRRVGYGPDPPLELQAEGEGPRRCVRRHPWDEGADASPC